MGQLVVKGEGQPGHPAHLNVVFGRLASLIEYVAAHGLEDSGKMRGFEAMMHIHNNNFGVAGDQLEQDMITGVVVLIAFQAQRLEGSAAL